MAQRAGITVVLKFYNLTSSVLISIMKIESSLPTFFSTDSYTWGGVRYFYHIKGVYENKWIRYQSFGGGLRKKNFVMSPAQGRRFLREALSRFRKYFLRGRKS
jgi:hypothetical protein